MHLTFLIFKKIRKFTKKTFEIFTSDEDRYEKFLRPINKSFNMKLKKCFYATLFHFS